MSGPLVVIGAGAIGGTLGAHVARAGHDVLLCDVDAEHVAAIQERGLSIEGPVEEFTVAVAAVTPDGLPDRIDRAIVAVNASARPWVAAVTRSRSRPGPATGTSGWTTNRQPAAVNWQTTGCSEAPVRAASSAAPPGMVVARPNSRTGTPEPSRSRSTSRHTERPSASQSRSTAELGRGPPDSGTTRMPSDSR